MIISRRDMLKAFGMSLIINNFRYKSSFSEERLKNINIKKIPVLMYHDINPYKKDNYTLSPPQFASQMEWLYSNRYTPIFLSEIQNREVISKIDKPIVITFDDAYSSILEYGYPYLEYYRFKFLVNVVGEYVGKFITFEGFKRTILSWDELLFLKNTKSVEFGYHGDKIHIFNWINLITETQFENDILTFKEKFRHFLNVENIEVMAFPYGHYKFNYIEIAKKLGFKYFLTSDEDIFKVDSTTNKDFYIIPRLNIHFKLDLISFREYIGG